MELYKKYPVTETNINGFAHKKATVDDVRTWAKGKGLALVPLEPTPAMKNAAVCVSHESTETGGFGHEYRKNLCAKEYKAMIRAAEEGHDK